MKRTAFFLIAVLLAIFSACSKDSSSEGQGGNAGGGNTTDLAVTGATLGVGMTYADVKGYVNITNEISAAAAANGLVFRVGVWYGENKNSLNRREVGVRNGREFTVTIPDLKAGKTYYYQSFLEWGDYVDWEPYFDQIGLASKIGSFTTKELKYNGSISAGEAKNITFFQADISGKVDMSSLSAKETVRRGFVWSSSRDAVTGQFASKLDNASRENTPGDAIVLDIGQGYFVNGNLHFFVGDETEATLFSEPGNKLYYTPFLIISGKSFAGEPREVTLRSLTQTSGFVDLGLSCLWGATNCRASSPWEMGIDQKAGYTSSDLAEQFGSGQRLPSKEEVQELNQKCSFEAIDNGVLITGPNGNQIFIPGESLADSYRSGHSLISNAYLSGTTRNEYVLGIWEKYQIGYYYVQGQNMTTTDLPVLSYPYNMGQHYYLRPVQDGQGGGGGGGGGDDPLSKALGTYSVIELQLDASGENWVYSDEYEMVIELSTASGGNNVLISNFWNEQYTVYATVLDSGDISIPEGQAIFDYSTYGEFYAYPYDPVTADLSDSGVIMLEYDSSNDMYHSTPFIPMNSQGLFIGMFKLQLQRK